MPLAEHEAATSAKDDEIAALQQQVMELAAAKVELDALKQAQADAAEEKKREELKAFAAASGLDVEADAVTTAIAGMDYEALIAAALENTTPATKAASQRPMADIAVTDPYGGILGKTNQ